MGGCSILNTEQAAKMLIVAWIKDWTMRTLLDSIDGKSSKEITQERIDDCHNKYQFMPNILHIYVSKKGRGMLVRSYVSYLSKKLNDALWDTDDNLKKLTFFSYIQTLKAKELGSMSRFTKNEMKELLNDRKDYREGQAGYCQSRNAYKLQRKTNWFQIK